MKSTSGPTFGGKPARCMDSNAEDKQPTSKAARSSQYGLPMSEPVLEQLRMLEFQRKQEHKPSGVEEPLKL